MQQLKICDIKKIKPDKIEVGNALIFERDNLYNYLQINDLILTPVKNTIPSDTIIIDTPANISPKDSAGVYNKIIQFKSTPVNVQCQSYIHGKYSQYQIIRKSDGIILYESNEIDYVTEYNVDISEIFNVDDLFNELQWKVRYGINTLFGDKKWSNWSQPTTFVIYKPNIIQPIGEINADDFPFEFKIITPDIDSNNIVETEWYVKRIYDGVVVYTSTTTDDYDTHIIDETLWSNFLWRVDHSVYVRQKILTYNRYTPWSLPATFRHNIVPDEKVEQISKYFSFLIENFNNEYQSLRFDDLLTFFCLKTLTPVVESKIEFINNNTVRLHFDIVQYGVFWSLTSIVGFSYRKKGSNNWYVTSGQSNQSQNLYNEITNLEQNSVYEYKSIIWPQSNPERKIYSDIIQEFKTYIETPIITKPVNNAQHVSLTPEIQFEVSNLNDNILSNRKAEIQIIDDETDEIVYTTILDG